MEGWKQTVDPLIHTFPTKISAPDVEMKKAEPVTPHFLNLGQDIVVGSKDEKCGVCNVHSSWVVRRGGKENPHQPTAIDRWGTQNHQSELYVHPNQFFSNANPMPRKREPPPTSRTRAVGGHHETKLT
jgi:hypothetical protein